MRFNLEDLDLQPLIKWPGGKSRFVRKMKARIPPHRVYTEPFFGGGSFFFEKPEADLSILGDASPRTIRFHESVRRGGLRRCREGVAYSRRAFKKAQRGTSACDVFATFAMSFHGNLKAFGGGARNYDGSSERFGQSRFGRQKLRSLDQYERMLRRAHLTIGDFERTVRLAHRTGGRETFYFLDPPWPIAYSKQYRGVGGRTDADLPVARVERVMRRISGKVWIVYNDHPEVRKVFCRRRGRWYCYRVRTPVNFGRSKSGRGLGGNRIGVTLLATNYRLR